MSSLQAFWSRLDGAIHPDDLSSFAAYPDHSFNLQFPPPAFVGALATAPIVLLMSNGGYKPGITEAEFPDAASISAYENYIRGKQAALPAKLSHYYGRGRLGAWVHAGTAVIVNAIAYRSPRLSQEPQNRALAWQLPSLAASRKWLMEEVLPDAEAGRRYVFVHRNGWWRVPSNVAGPNVIFSDLARAEPNRYAPDKHKLDVAEAWLRGRIG